MSSTTSKSKKQEEAIKANNDLAQIIQTTARPVIQVITIVLPILIVAIRRLYREFQKLPQNALLFLYGSVICFFGGTFPTLFAALQAAEHGGRQQVLEALSDLSTEAMIIIEESKKDDEVDDNKDGIKDVEQISGRELFLRKTKLVLKKMNPDKIDKAISSLYTVWISVSTCQAFSPFSFSKPVFSFYHLFFK